MAPGDMVLLSLDGLHAAAGRVTIQEVGPTWITVASRKPIMVERYERQWRELNGQQPPTETDGAAAAAAGVAAGGAGAAAGGAGAPAAGPAVWRLDKDEIASMSVTLRTNLLRLVLDGGAARAARLRALIIDLEAPRTHGLCAAAGEGGGGAAAAATQVEQTQGGLSVPATAAATRSTPGAGAGLRLRLRLEAAERFLQSDGGAGLNAEQAAAVRRVAGSEDYSLILGMPGTGKTSTIAAAIRALTASGASVLVTAYTNSAVDNILLKLAQLEVRFFGGGS